MCQAQRAVGFPVSRIPLCAWEVYGPRHRPQPSRCPDSTDGTCTLHGMAAVSICERCTDTAPGTKGQGDLDLWLHPKDGFNKKGKRTQIHNFNISRDAGFSQYLFNSYFRSLRSSLARQLEQRHGPLTWAMSLGRSSCVSLRRQRVMACFPCALE